MRIEIVKCSNENAWYKDEIGETYNVLGELGTQHIVKDIDNVLYGVEIVDCKEIIHEDAEITIKPNISITVNLTHEMKLELIRGGMDPRKIDDDEMLAHYLFNRVFGSVLEHKMTELNYYKSEKYISKNLNGIFQDLNIFDFE